VIRSLFRTSRPALAAVLLATSGLAGAAQVGGSAADRLSSYLRELSSNPNSLPALIGAGQASLGVGDGNAALGFFARADEQAPRNGQVKAGLARALLMVDNPRDALRMFNAATDLGVPEAEIAGDRGLAYDLRGDQKRAQRDYALALTRGPNDEVTKRYALSLGISGDRDTALKLLDPLLYKRDQGAWRARAFVLAMTGDQPGANQIVRQVMPERMAVAMAPFLQKLPTLRPAEKAAAVHLGEMPSDGTRYAAAPEPIQSAPPPPPTRIAAASPTPSPAVVPVSRDPRRRPGTTTRVAPAPTPAPNAPPSALPEQQRGDLAAIMADIRAAAQARNSGGPVTPTPTPAPAATTPLRVAQATPTPRPAARITPTPTPKVTPEKPATASKGTKATKGKAAAEEEVDKTDKTGKADPKKKPDPKDKADPKGKKAKAEPKSPARIWVQVASGGNAAAMPREWKRVQAKAPAAFKGKSPSTAPGRLLVGPFKTDGEAQAFVNTLRKAGVSSFQWDSPAGQDVAKLSGK
jgi:Flp pilus assembly protein TadD